LDKVKNVLPNGGVFNGDESHGIESVTSHLKLTTNPSFAAPKLQEELHRRIPTHGVG